MSNHWRHLPRIERHRGWLRIGRWWYRVIDGRLVCVPLITGGMTDPTIDQNAWGQVLDDGSESGSTLVTSAANQVIDGGWTQLVDTVFRVRFEMLHTAGDAANGRTYQLQLDINGGGFNDVTASTALQGAASAETSWTITDGDATATDRLTGDGGSFIAGEYVEADGLSGNTNIVAAFHNEMEFCCTIDSAQVNDADTIALQVVMSGAQGTPTYGATPTITVDKPAAFDGTTFPRGAYPDQARRTRMSNLAGMTPACHDDGDEVVGWRRAA